MEGRQHFTSLTSSLQCLIQLPLAQFRLPSNPNYTWQQPPHLVGDGQDDDGFHLQYS